MQWVDPVFDRNQEDINNAFLIISKYAAGGLEILSVSEKEQWRLGLKGCINYTDWQRITGNIHFVAFWAAVFVSCKTVWVIGEIPSREEINKIKIDMENLRNSVDTSIPNVPELPYTQFQKINDIERILFLIKEFYEEGASVFERAGMWNAYAGNEIHIVTSFF